MARTVKIAKIKPFMKGLNLKVKVTKVLGTKEVFSRKTGSVHKVMEVLVEDETGQMNLSIWDNKITNLEEGEVYEVTNAYASRFKGKTVINIGKYGNIKKVDEGEKSV